MIGKVKTQNIKAVILDVDGVIVGKKIGVNSPYPSKKIIEKLKAVSLSGIPIHLCTAKPYFAIEKIVKDAGLFASHIVEGGAGIYDAKEGKFIERHPIPIDEAKEVFKKLLVKKIYTEIYDGENYYVDSSWDKSIQDRHTHVLQKPPIQIENILNGINHIDVLRLMMIVNDVEEKEEAQKLFEDINTKLVLSWGVHPVILPLQFGIITALEISKEYGAMKIFEVSGISGENTLAIGDSTSDWQFMELCRFCGSMENGSDDLKKLLGKKHQNGIVGGSVDEDGLLEIFKYFGI